MRRWLFKAVMDGREMARHGAARCGVGMASPGGPGRASCDVTGRGESWPGGSWSGDVKAVEAGLRRGEALRGQEWWRLGVAWLGGRGWARRGHASHGLTWPWPVETGRSCLGRGVSRRDGAKARRSTLGQSWLGAVWPIEACRGVSSCGGHGMSVQGEARSGQAWLGLAVAAGRGRARLRSAGRRSARRSRLVEAKPVEASRGGPARASLGSASEARSGTARFGSAALAWRGRVRRRGACPCQAVLVWPGRVGFGTARLVRVCLGNASRGGRGRVGSRSASHGRARLGWARREPAVEAVPDEACRG